MSDAVVDEVCAACGAVARESGYDAKKLADALRERQQKSGSKAVRQPSHEVRSKKKAS